MFKYFDEFHKAALFHFLISAICGALFALGLEFSKGSDGDDVAYFIPAMVLSGIHFSLCVIALLLFCITYRSAVAVRTSSSRARKHYSRLKAMHHLINMPSFIWSIIGAAITGSTGICAKEESKCYYTVNIAVNRAIAIIILIIHILNAFATYLILTTSRSPSRTSAVGPHLRHTANHNIEKKPLDHRAGIIKNSTGLSNENKINNNEENNQKHLIKLKLRRHHSAFETISHSVHKRGQSADDIATPGRNTRAADGTAPSKIKPLPRRNKKLLLSAVGKLLYTFNTSKVKRNNETDSDENPAFKLADSTSSSSSSNEDSRRVLVQRKPKFSFARSSTSGQSQPTEIVPHLRPPPPSYNDVVMVADNMPEANPYWLPPLPQGGAEMHRLPENIYSGSSYPDTELVAVEPSHVYKR